MERSADVQVDSRGRVVIPASVRKQLGIHGQSADVKLTVEVIE